METPQARQPHVEKHPEMMIDVEEIRAKPEKTADEEKFLAAWDKAQAERRVNKEFEKRVQEKDAAQMAETRKEIAAVRAPHIEEHSEQFMKRADIEAALAEKQRAEAAKQQGVFRRTLGRWAQFFRASK